MERTGDSTPVTRRRLHRKGRSAPTLGGAYKPNHLLVVLGANVPYLRDRGDPPTPDDAYLHIFVHEYWHYLQNTTTIAGFKGFAFTQQTVAHFTHSLAPDGSSHGKRVLNADLRTRNAVLSRLYFDFEGSCEPSAPWPKEVVDFVVTDIRRDKDDLDLGGRKAPNPIVFASVRATDRDGTSHIADLLVGSAAIEESVAYLVEEHVRAVVGESPPDPPAAFPYRVVERMIEHVLGGPCDDAWVPAALGTLALLAPHPGRALLFAANTLKAALENGEPSDRAVELVRRKFENQVQDAVARIFLHDLPEMIAMQKGRGHLEHALQHIGAVFRRGLTKRKSDPLFDVRAVFRPTADWDLVSLKGGFPSCDILQEHTADDTFPRDRIYCVDPTPPDENGLTPTEVTRVFQAQQDFVFAHLGDDDEFVASSDAISRCPYFDACDLDLRRARPGDCRTAPWRSYRAGRAGATGCVYSVAVAGTLGLVSIKKNAASSDENVRD